MKIPNTIVYVLIVCFLSSCGGRPENLIGKWKWKQNECLLADRDSLFKSTNAKYRYILEFHDDKNVSIEFPDQEIRTIAADKGGDPKQGHTKICSVFLKGTYSFTLFGNIKFDFKDEEDNSKIETSSDCSDASARLVLGSEASTQMDSTTPSSDDKVAPYLKEQSITLKQKEANTLEIIIPGYTKCEKERITVYFERTAS